MRSRSSILAVFALSLGCASASPAPRAPRADLSGALEGWTSAGEESPDASPTGPRFREASARPAPPGRARTVRVEGEGESAWPVGGRRIDVRFEQAPLSSALRVLAEAAELGIVIGEGLDDRISLDLRRVRPVEAMHALARAHGVELELVGGTVVARRAGS